MAKFSYLNQDKILLNLILRHFPAVSAPLGHCLCLAQGHLVHLLDVVVQVAGSAAGVLANRADPWLGRTGKQIIDVNFISCNTGHLCVVIWFAKALLLLVLYSQWGQLNLKMPA